MATALGTILLLAGAYLVLDDDEPSSTGPTAPKVSTPPSQTGGDEIPEGFEKFFQDAEEGADGITVTGDPLRLAGTGTTVHNVNITLTSDGPMKFVYRTQNGDTAPRVADRHTSINYKLRGPRAVAQAFVQVLQGSSYATCTITIDGERVSTATARSTYQVVACTG